MPDWRKPGTDASGPEVVKALVDAGGALGAEDDGSGRTALDYAKGRRESGMVAALEELVSAATQVSGPRVKPLEAEVVLESGPRPAVRREPESVDRTSSGRTGTALSLATGATDRGGWAGG